MYGILNNLPSCSALNHLILIGKHLLYCNALNGVMFYCKHAITVDSVLLGYSSVLNVILVVL